MEIKDLLVAVYLPPLLTHFPTEFVWGYMRYWWWDAGCYVTSSQKTQRERDKVMVRTCAVLVPGNNRKNVLKYCTNSTVTTQAEKNPLPCPSVSVSWSPVLLRVKVAAPWHGEEKQHKHRARLGVKAGSGPDLQPCIGVSIHQRPRGVLLAAGGKNLCISHPIVRVWTFLCNTTFVYGEVELRKESLLSFINLD